MGPYFVGRSNNLKYAIKPESAYDCNYYLRGAITILCKVIAKKPESKISGKIKTL